MGATCPRSSVRWGRWLLPGRQAHPSQPTVKTVFCEVPRGTPNATTHLIVCTVLSVFERLGSCCKFGFCRQLSPHFSGAFHWPRRLSPLGGLGSGKVGRAWQVCSSQGLSRCGGPARARGRTPSSLSSPSAESLCARSSGACKTNLPAPLTGLTSL